MSAPLASGPWPDAVLGGRAPGLADRPARARLVLVGAPGPGNPAPGHPGPGTGGHGTVEPGTGEPETIDLPVDRWHGPVLAPEAAVLQRAVDPVLDVGCGPGRHVEALVAGGRRALGIDVSAAAVAATRSRGGAAVRTSVFGPVPDAGRWGSALLFDGNIGIGGDPERLLRRLHELLRPGGTVLAEVEPPHVPSRRFWARVDHAGRIGPGFAWARVGAGRIALAASRAGFATREVWCDDGRWFAELARTDAPPGGRT